nr:uncharacterized protein LOC113826246 [Penaeus vannamei]
MESLVFRDVRGDVIFVEERLEPASCNKRATEFSVSSSRIQFLPWLGYTSVLAAIAFLAQLHTLHPAWLLTAVLTQLATLLYRVHRKVVSVWESKANQKLLPNSLNVSQFFFSIKVVSIEECDTLYESMFKEYLAAVSLLEAYLLCMPRSSLTKF